MTFQEGLKSYYAKYPGGATRELYEGLFPYMQSLGFQVERPTRSGRNPDGSRRLSSDKIVNSATGELFDIIKSVDDVTGAGGWMIHTPKTWKYWIDGKAATSPTGSTSVLGASGADDGVLRNYGPLDPSTMRFLVNSGQPPRNWAGVVSQMNAQASTALGSPADAFNPYGAAASAALLQRKRARAGGRSSTILGGFKPGTPTTRPTVLGGY